MDMYNGMHIEKSLNPLPVVLGFMILEHFDHSVIWRARGGC